MEMKDMRNGRDFIIAGMLALNLCMHFVVRNTDGISAEIERKLNRLDVQARDIEQRCLRAAVEIRTNAALVLAVDDHVTAIESDVIKVITLLGPFCTDEQLQNSVAQATRFMEERAKENQQRMLSFMQASNKMIGGLQYRSLSSSVEYK